VRRADEEIHESVSVHVADPGEVDTESGVVAELRPPGDGVKPESPVEARLRMMAEEGGLHIGEPNDPSAYGRSPIRVAPGTAGRFLEAERGER